MKKFFFKLKKLLNPTTAVCAAAGLVTIVLYLLFGNPSTKGESALFLFSIFLCLTVLGVIAGALLTAREVPALDEDSSILNDMSLYSEMTGLTLEPETGKAEFI